MNSSVKLVSIAFALLLGVSSTASATVPSKSWEVDLYGNEAELTYVDDGYDDVTVYDHEADDYSYDSYADSNDYGYVEYADEYADDYAPQAFVDYEDSDAYRYDDEDYCD